MKTSESKTASPSQHTEAKGNEAFFHKEGGESFFSEKQGEADFFFSPKTVQPKLKIGRPGDRYEQEADAMADKVVKQLAQPDAAMAQPPAPSAKTGGVATSIQPKGTQGEQEEPEIQRKPIFESESEPAVQTKPMAATESPQIQQAPEEEELSENGLDLEAKSDFDTAAPPDDDENTLQTQAEASPAPAAPDLSGRLAASKGGGAPLPEQTRGSMESAFGADFSGVRVHTGAEAGQMNQELRAQAFTHGSDIYFNEGKYDTGSPEGQKLLAHELTHTVQQGGVEQFEDTNADEKGDQSGFIQRQPEEEQSQDNSSTTSDETTTSATQSGVEGDQNVTETAEHNGSDLAEGSGDQMSTRSDSGNLENNQSSIDGNGSSPGSPANSSLDTSQISNGGNQGNTGAETNPGFGGNIESGGGASTTFTPNTAAVSQESSTPAVNSQVSSTPITSEPLEGGRDVMAAYNEMVQWAETEKLNVAQRNEQLKQQVLDNAELEKQAIVSLAVSQVARFRADIQATITAINTSRDNAREAIETQRAEKIAATNAAADQEIASLESLVQERREALALVQESMVSQIDQHGTIEADRSVAQSLSNAGEMQEIITGAGTQYANREGAADLEAEARDRAVAMSQEFNRAGSDIASQVLQNVQIISQGIRDEATDISGQFEEPLQEGRDGINEKRDLTIADLETTGNEFLSTLDQEADEIIQELQTQADQQEASIREIGSGAFVSIDEAANQAVANLDAAALRAVTELDEFILQLEEIGWHPQEMLAAQADVQTALLEHDQEMQEYVGEVSQSFTEHTSRIGQEGDLLLTEINTVLTSLQTDFQTELDGSVGEITTSMETIASEAIGQMQTVVPNLEPELNNAVSDTEAEWSDQVTESETEMSGMVDDGLEVQTTALSDFSSNLHEDFADLPSGESSFWEDAWDVVSTIGEFIGGVVYGLFEGLWELLKGIWEIIITPAKWLMVVVVVIIAVIVIAIVAVLLSVEFLVAAVIVGVVVGLIAAAYYIYQAITATGVSPFERGRLVGRGIFEGIMAFVGTGIIARLAAWSTRIAQLVNIVNRIGGISKLLPILTKVDDIERLISLIARIDDAAALARLINRAQDANALLRLLDGASDAGRIITFLDGVQDMNLILSHVDDAATLLRIIDRVGDIAQFERVLARVQNVGRLIELITSLDNSSQLLGFLDEVGDINAILAKVGDAQTLLRLISNTDNAAQLERLLLLDKVTDAAQLDRLLSLDAITDAAQLESLIGLTDDIPQLEGMLRLIPSGDDLLRYINLAGGRTQTQLLERIAQEAVASGDYRRIENLLNLANSNGAMFERLAQALLKFRKTPATNLPITPHPPYTLGPDRFAHFLDHTYEYCDLANRVQKNLGTTFWPENTLDTDVLRYLEEVLTALDHPGAPLIAPPNPRMTTVTRSGFEVHLGAWGTSAAPVINQFFPISGPGVIHFTQAEIQSFARIFGII